MEPALSQRSLLEFEQESFMTRRVLLGAVLATATFAVAASRVSLGAQSSIAPAEAGQKISGLWHFNKDLSSPPPEDPIDQGGSPGAPPGSAGGGGRPPGGGGRGGGGRGGGFAGAGGGGRGGGQRPNSQMLVARKVFRSLMDPANTITIVATADTANITSDDGRVEKYQIDGKKHDVEIEGSTISAVTDWNTNVLRQSFTAGASIITRTIQTTDTGTQLVMGISQGSPSERQAGGASATPSLKLIFDRDAKP
jgi:hypothetical protein